MTTPRPSSTTWPTRPPVRALGGCRRYALFRDPHEPARFLLYEEWATAAAFDAYQSHRLRDAFAVLRPMMAGSPDGEYFEAEPLAR